MQSTTEKPPAAKKSSKALDDIQQALARSHEHITAMIETLVDHMERQDREIARLKKRVSELERRT